MRSEGTEVDDVGVKATAALSFNVSKEIVASVDTTPLLAKMLRGIIAHDDPGLLLGLVQNASA